MKTKKTIVSDKGQQKTGRKAKGKLTRLRVSVNAARPREVNDGVPHVYVEGDVVTMYAKADAIHKEAEASLKDLRPALIEVGVDEYLKFNEGSSAPSSSVKLIDDLGAAAVVTYQDRYSAVQDPEKAEAIFAKINEARGEDELDVNDFVHEVIHAKFDHERAFMVNGRFSEERYRKYRDAIHKLDREFGLIDDQGAGSTLSTTRAIVPKPNFHEKRMKLLSVEENKQLSTVFTNVVSIRVASTG